MKHAQQERDELLVAAWKADTHPIGVGGAQDPDEGRECPVVTPRERAASEESNQPEISARPTSSLRRLGVGARGRSWRPGGVPWRAKPTAFPGARRGTARRRHPVSRGLCVIPRAESAPGDRPSSGARLPSSPFTPFRRGDSAGA